MHMHKETKRYIIYISTVRSRLDCEGVKKHKQGEQTGSRGEDIVLALELLGYVHFELLL